MRCDKCGTINDNDATFCKKCATKFEILEAELDLESQLEEHLQAIQKLNERAKKQNARIVALEESLAKAKPDAGLEGRLARIERRLTSSAVFSEDFGPRALAIWGHAITIGAVVGFALFLIAAAIK